MPGGQQGGPTVESAAGAAPVELDPRAQWGEVGCTPDGAELRFTAVYRVDPPTDAMGKHLRGEWLEADDGTRWLVSYSGGRFHPELSGRRVDARGKACVKQGQSVGAKHFALSALLVVGD